MSAFIIATGRLGKDATVNKTRDGREVVSFSMAVDKGFKREDGTDWFNVSVWGNVPQGMMRYLLKGYSIMVYGRFATEEYQGRDGTMQRGLKINADRIEFPPRSGNGQNQNGQNNTNQNQSSGGWGDQEDPDDITAEPLPWA